MTQPFVPPPSIYNDPSNLDVWVNSTDHTFKVTCHIDHKGGPPTPQHPKGGPRYAVYEFKPHSETVVPTEYRYVIHQYLCENPECRNSAGSKLCHKDHPAVVVGGQAPQLVRKNASHIRPNPVFNHDEFVERRKVDASGRVFFETERLETNAPQGPAVARSKSKE